MAILLYHFSWSGPSFLKMLCIVRTLDGLRLFRKRQGLPPSIYSWGDTLGLADCCLIPQLVNAPRMGLELTSLNIPLTLGVFENAMAHSAVQASHPDRF